jgi:WD40 repeat protein
VNTNDSFYIYPIKTFYAHQSFIRDLKWCKFDPNILASGSTFSRDLKLWNIQNTDKPIIEYEIFVTEFEFSLHNNHLFITKETNLKKLLF